MPMFTFTHASRSFDRPYSVVVEPANNPARGRERDRYDDRYGSRRGGGGGRGGGGFSEK